MSVYLHIYHQTEYLLLREITAVIVIGILIIIDSYSKPGYTIYINNNTYFRIDFYIIAIFVVLKIDYHFNNGN